MHPGRIPSQRACLLCCVQLVDQKCFVEVQRVIKDRLPLVYPIAILGFLYSFPGCLVLKRLKAI